MEWAFLEILSMVIFVTYGEHGKTICYGCAEVVLMKPNKL